MQADSAVLFCCSTHNSAVVSFLMRSVVQNALCADRVSKYLNNSYGFERILTEF
jgi:hypothetical protein